MPRLPSLKRDDATGVYLHRVGDRWLPLEQAHAEREARGAARSGRERSTAPHKGGGQPAEDTQSQMEYYHDSSEFSIISSDVGTAPLPGRTGSRPANTNDMHAVTRPGREDA